MSKKIGSSLALGILLIGLFSANVSQAVVYTWTNGATSGSANVTNNASWTPAATNNFYLTASSNGLTFSNYYTQAADQTFNWAAVNVGITNQIVSAYTKNVIFTNVGEWRFVSGNLTLTNSSGLVGTNAGTLCIYNTNDSSLGTSPTWSGNMAFYLGTISAHSSSSRTLTQNLPSLCISNFGVCGANSSQLFTPGTMTATMTFNGSGTSTIIGPIYSTRLTNSTNGYTNNSALIIASGTFNIASTNTNNTNTTAYNLQTGAAAVYGWNSGLIITNSASVYIAGQRSLGVQAWDVKIGTTNAGATTFGVFTNNEWATNSTTSVPLTNNFAIANSGAGTNIFKAQTGRTLALSGTISGSVNGTIVADAGTLLLSGANTALSLPFVVTNSGTLVASNNSALGSSSVTVASGATLKVNAAIANSVTNNGGVTIADGGTLVSSNGYSGSGSLSVGATAPSTASFTSSLLVGTNSVGPLSFTGNGTLGMNVATQVKSSGAVAITSTNNRITVTGTAKVGTNDLVVGTSLTGASASSIVLNGSGVGTPSTPIALGSTYTAGDGTKYTFTNSATALQLVVEGQGPQDLAFADASGLWNTDSANTPWKTVPGGVSASFRTGDSTAYTNAATVGVDIGGVSPNVLSFANPVSTAVVITNGPITATTVTASGAGSVNVSSDLTATAGITISSGVITLAKTTINSGGLSVAGGSLTNSGVTTITAGGLNVGGGAVTSSGSTTITAGGLNVSAGTLAVSGSISAGAVNVTGGTVTGSGSITGSSYNVANATYGVNLTGANSLTVSGTSTLNGANSSFSGPVSVTGGNLSLGTSSALGTGALNLSGGSVLTLSSGTLGNSIALGAGGGGVSNSGDVTISGAVTNATGQINQALSKSGAGVLTLSGTVGTASPMIGLSIAQGTLQLQGSQYNLTNLAVTQGAKLLINGGVLNTRQIKAGGTATNSIGNIEITNTVTWSNTIGASSFTNPIVIDANSRFISGPMTASTYGLTFESGVSGPGYLEINRCVDLSTNTNTISGWIGVGSMTVNTNALLRIVAGGFTNPNTTITNLGKILVNNSSGVSNLISSTYPGVTGVTTVTNKFMEMSGSGTIAQSGSQPIVLDGLISGSNKISMEGTAGSSAITLVNSNSFTGGVDFTAPAATNNNGTIWFLNSNALGSGPISNSINSANASIKTYTPAGGSVQDWTLTNTINTGTLNTAVLSFGSGASNSLTLSGKVSGGGQLKMSSSAGGELRLANTGNDYSGGTEVGAGAIVISNSAALGTGTVNFGTSADSVLKVTGTTTLTNAMTISGLLGTSTSTTPYTAYINVSANKTFTNSGGVNNKLSVGTTTNDQKYGGNLVKQGAGTAVLSGVNGYSGSTTINDGTLTLSGTTLSTPLVSLTGSSAAVLKLMSTGVLSSSVSFTGDNASANTGTVDFNAAGSYTFNRYGESAANPGLNMNFTNSSSGAVTATFTNGTNYITDPTGSGGGKTIWNRSTSLTLVFSGAMEIGSSENNDFGLSGDGNFTLNGSVTNSGIGIRALTKSGAGTANLNAVNSYNGATTVNQGTLVVGASGSLPVASPITVSNGATLRFNNSSSGIDVGAMTVAGNLEQYLITITSSGAVDLTGSTLKVNGTPTLDSYKLVSGTSVTGTPTLNPTISGYKLSNSATSLLLVKKATPAVVVTPGTYTYSGAIQGPGTAEVSTGGSTSTPSLSYSGTTSSGSTYGPSSTPPTAPGSYTVTATTAEDSNYIAGTSSATAFAIGKATPSITPAPTASDITFGQTLADSNLTGGTASTAGSFAFTTPSTSPNVGTANQDVTFTPNDTANYSTATTSVSVTVGKATPTISAAPAASDIIFGQTLADSNLTGGSASTPGSFAFTTPSTSPSVGTANQAVTFTPNDTANYSTATTSASVTVTASAPTGLSYSSSSINGTIGTAIADLTPAVTGSGITYSIDPALPTGLLLNPTTGVIIGTPSVTSASAIYTVSATNVGGSTTTTLTIGVGYALGPVAVDDALTKSANNGSILIQVSELLKNDYRITNSSGARASDGDGLSVTAVTSGSGNTATLAGVFIRFTPSSASTDTFTYTVSDGTRTATGTVTVTTETEAPVFNLQIVQVGTATLLGGTTTVTHDFIGVPNQTYLVEYATDLAGAWTSVGNQSTGVTGSFSVSITKSGDFVSEWNEHMFFRARLVR